MGDRIIRGFAVTLALLVLLGTAGTAAAHSYSDTERLEAWPSIQVPKEGRAVREIRPVEPVPTSPEPLPKVALTFDDGPDVRNTPLILDLLKDEQVPATFFVVGTQVERYPEMLVRIFEEGHLIANHSRTHADFAELTNEEILKLELEPTSQAVQQLTGYYPLTMRPPYGSLRPDSVQFLKDQGWKIVRWSLDTFDWDSRRNSTEEILARIEELHHPGAIILMHCNGPATIKALPGVISTLRELGYQFVTVRDL